VVDYQTRNIARAIFSARVVSVSVHIRVTQLGDRDPTAEVVVSARGVAPQAPRWVRQMIHEHGSGPAVLPPNATMYVPCTCGPGLPTATVPSAVQSPLMTTRWPCLSGNPPMVQEPSRHPSGIAANVAYGCLLVRDRGHG
jgi:hypothetical protein